MSPFLSLPSSILCASKAEDIWCRGGPAKRKPDQTVSKNIFLLAIHHVNYNDSDVDAWWWILWKKSEDMIGFSLTTLKLEMVQMMILNFPPTFKMIGMDGIEISQIK